MIPPGMEQPDDFARDRINARQVGSLVTVTVDATQGEVFGVRWTAVFLGDDVINLKVEAGELLREVAIFAAERGSLTDEFHELPLHTGSRGGVLCLERKERFGLHELNEPADVKVIFEILPFLVGQRTAPRFRGQFIGAAQISIGQLEGEDRTSCFRAPRFVVGGDRPFEDSAFGIGYRAHASYLKQPRALINNANEISGTAAMANRTSLDCIRWQDG